jgi:hypothetical protein
MSLPVKGKEGSGGAGAFEIIGSAIPGVVGISRDSESCGLRSGTGEHTTRAVA